MWPPPLRLASPLRSPSPDGPDAPAGPPPAPPASTAPPAAPPGPSEAAPGLAIERSSRPLFRLVGERASLSVPGQSPPDAYAPFEMQPARKTAWDEAVRRAGQ